MAKVTVEMNVDDDTVEEAVGSVSKLMSKFAGLEQANKDMSESMQALAKAISKNNGRDQKAGERISEE
tara:strand:- start:392 stop:595 length:204 start_codon:yes stop_codon:yes gene_type:complete